MFLLCTLLFLWRAHGAPLQPQRVDMTHTFDETTQSYPNIKRFQLDVIQNGTTDQGNWLQMEDYSSGIHTGTHMDAPCHFYPDRWTIDEIPLERFEAPAAVIDITYKAQANPDAMLDIPDLQNWEQITGMSLDGTIVVMRSGYGRRWGDRTAYIGSSDDDPKKLHYPGISPEAAQWLVENRNVYGVAVDSLSLDAGQTLTYMAHKILLRANIFALENVANVENLPIVGAFIRAMPMKIGKASGAPVRIVGYY